MVVHQQEQDFTGIGISNHLEETTEYFEIFGELEQGWERFKRNTNYRSFVLKLKDEVN
jgi:hypothetical protein